MKYNQRSEKSQTNNALGSITKPKLISTPSSNLIDPNYNKTAQKLKIPKSDMMNSSQIGPNGATITIIDPYHKRNFSDAPKILTENNSKMMAMNIIDSNNKHYYQQILQQQQVNPENKSSNMIKSSIISSNQKENKYMRNSVTLSRNTPDLYHNRRQPFQQQQCEDQNDLPNNNNSDIHDEYGMKENRLIAEIYEGEIQKKSTRNENLIKMLYNIYKPSSNNKSLLNKSITNKSNYSNSINKNQASKKIETINDIQTKRNSLANMYSYQNYQNQQQQQHKDSKLLSTSLQIKHNNNLSTIKTIDDQFIPCVYTDYDIQTKKSLNKSHNNMVESNINTSIHTNANNSNNTSSISNPDYSIPITKNYSFKRSSSINDTAIPLILNTSYNILLPLNNNSNKAIFNNNTPVSIAVPVSTPTPTANGQAYHRVENINMTNSCTIHHYQNNNTTISTFNTNNKDDNSDKPIRLHSDKSKFTPNEKSSSISLPKQEKKSIKKLLTNTTLQSIYTKVHNFKNTMEKFKKNEINNNESSHQKKVNDSNKSPNRSFSPIEKRRKTQNLSILHNSITEENEMIKYYDDLCVKNDDKPRLITLEDNINQEKNTPLKGLAKIGSKSRIQKNNGTKEKTNSEINGLNKSTMLTKKKYSVDLENIYIKELSPRFRDLKDENNRPISTLEKSSIKGDKEFEPSSKYKYVGSVQLYNQIPKPSKPKENSLVIEQTDKSNNYYRNYSRKSSLNSNGSHYLEEMIHKDNKVSQKNRIIHRRNVKSLNESNIVEHLRKEDILAHDQNNNYYQRNPENSENIENLTPKTIKNPGYINQLVLTTRNYGNNDDNQKGYKDKIDIRINNHGLQNIDERMNYYKDEKSNSHRSTDQQQATELINLYQNRGIEKKFHHSESPVNENSIKYENYMISSRDSSRSCDDEALRLRLISIIKEQFLIDKQIQETNLEYYRLIRMIGKGAFGKVYLGVHLLTGKNVAIKSIERHFMKDEMSKKKIFQEVMILRKICHKNVIRLLEVFENKKYLFIVTEYAAKGDLLAKIKQTGRINEIEAQKIFYQIVEGVKHCHKVSILHRDIKLDNVLLDHNNNVKICDFGVSRFIKKSQIIKEQCGTPAYIAPEIILDQGYEGFYADIWSLGILLYAMVTSTVPFKAKNLAELHNAILSGKYTFPSYLSDGIQNLISQMLVLNPYERIDIEDIQKHAWFANYRLELGLRYTDNDTINTLGNSNTNTNNNDRVILDNTRNFNNNRRNSILNIKCQDSISTNFTTNTFINPDHKSGLSSSSSVSSSSPSLTSSLATLKLVDCIIKKVEEYGYTKDFIIKSINNNSFNHATASYFLLYQDLIQ